jgi:putative spermidine/putrescine transport system permease protein
MDDVPRRLRLASWAVAAPLLAVLLLFEIAPLAAVVINGVSPAGSLSLSNYAELAGSAFQRNAFANSVALSAGTALLALVLAMPVGVSLRRLPAGVQRVALTYANVAANFTGFPIAFAFVILFGLSGSVTLILVRLGIVDHLNLYSTGGLALVYCSFQIPLAVLLIYPGLSAVSDDLDEAALLMGASRRTFWLRIGLPILAPSLAGSFVLLFANAMGTYATAYALVGGNANLVTIRIGELVAGDVFTDPSLADALATILVLFLAIPILLEQLVFRRHRRGG